jgi:hypothetical protein
MFTHIVQAYQNWLKEQEASPASTSTAPSEKQESQASSEPTKSQDVTKVSHKYPNNKALHIGINYIGTSHSLGGCINDTLTMTDLTKDYVPDHRRLILTDNTQHKPTARNIKQALKWLLCTKCGRQGLWSCPHTHKHPDNTTLYFTYSGHGTYTHDTSGDEKDGQDEAIYALDGTVTDDYIFDNFVTKVPRLCTTYIVMDMCHSGTSIDLRYSIEAQAENEYKLVDHKNKSSIGEVFMLSGCRDTQSSYDTVIDDKYQGALTATLKNILNDNPDVSIAKMSYLVKKYLNDNGYPQMPNVSFGKNLLLDKVFFSPM